MDAFHQCGRVDTKFFSAFQVAYDALKPRAASADEHKGADDAVQDSCGDAEQDAGGDAEQAAGHGRKTKAEELNNFKKGCEAKTKDELDARCVSLVVNGGTVDIQIGVTSTRLYQNLTAQATLMGFYDVKNARLCNTFDGEGVLFLFSAPSLGYPGGGGMGGWRGGELGYPGGGGMGTRSSLQTILSSTCESRADARRG